MQSNREEVRTIDHRAVVAGSGADGLGIGFDDRVRRSLVFLFPDWSDFILL